MRLSNIVEKPVIVIMRGLPGSGKSYTAQQLAGEDGVVFSSDDFINYDEPYEKEKAMEAHRQNIERTEQAMRDGHPFIIIDNTNTRKLEAKPYVQLAVKYGYDVKFEESTAPWKDDVDELARRNTHGVPGEHIAKMKDRWEDDFTISNILQTVHPDEMKL